MATATRAVYLPAGTRPGWELNDDEINPEGGEWHNVADSLVILQSLKQSREKWLSSAFPKFSGRARGSKQPEVKPPAHSVKSHNRFEFSVGPHVFSNTRLYEIHYLPEHPIPIASHAPAPATSFSSNIAPSTSQFDVNPPSQPRFNDFVTPALLEQVTQAAATDPILHNLLTLAQRNQLSEDQRATLTAFVRSLNERLGPHYAGPEIPAAGPSSVANPAPPRPFDLVIEFQERLSDRWLVPRGTVYLADAYGSNGGSLYDVIVTINLSLAQSAPTTQEDDPMTGGEVPTQTVKLHWRGLQQESYDILMAWSRGDTISHDSDELKNASNTTKRTYLAHQLPEGELLEILRAACTPYQMKSIKPANADSTKARRRASTRKSTTEKPTPMNIPNTGGVVSTLNFSQPTPSQPDAQMYVPPASSSTPVPVHTPPVGAPSFNQSVFPVLPHQPVVWNPPPPPPSYPVEQFTPAPAPPPPVQYSPPIQPYTPHLSGGAAYSPPPPPVESSAAGPSAPRTQSSSPGGTSKAADYSGVSFAPISTPAIEAKVVEIHQKKAARPKPKKLPPVPMPPPIRCRACQETGLPLLMGGRICRQCLESGRLSEAIPDISSGTTQTGRKSPSEPASPTSTSPAE